ncbi:hypothetical protein EVAR_22971_1 [Eumeta japonica]|uniref:Uncharacterized protein n=1 Tax=Eumeta variegata TaxID=151549 RepID=A0A4C1UPZ0_EUMVA|nr:hypothetical protein EVAR_22971_1 [Eumeta japonica]
MTEPARVVAASRPRTYQKLDLQKITYAFGKLIRVIHPIMSGGDRRARRPFINSSPEPLGITSQYVYSTFRLINAKSAQGSSQGPPPTRKNICGCGGYGYSLGHGSASRAPVRTQSVEYKPYEAAITLTTGGRLQPSDDRIDRKIRRDQHNGSGTALAARAAKSLKL